MNSLARIGAPTIPALMSYLDWNPEGFNDAWEALARDTRRWRCPLR
jgi:hypothetical protein